MPTADLSTYIFLSVCQLPTGLLPTCLPLFLCLSLCQLSTCLLPTCPPSFSQYAVCVYRLPVLLCLSLCQLSTADLSTYLFFSMPTYLPSSYPPMSFSLPTVYRQPVHLASLNMQYVSAAVLSTVYLSSYSLVSAYFYHRPVNLGIHFCLPAVYMSTCLLSS